MSGGGHKEPPKVEEAKNISAEGFYGNLLLLKTA